MRKHVCRCGVYSFKGSLVHGRVFLFLILSIALVSPVSVPNARAAVNDLASVANATAAANLLLNGATGITLTGTPTLIAANASTAMKQFTSIDQGAGRQISGSGIYLDSIGSSPGANNTVLRNKLVSVLSAGGYNTTVTQITALTFQVIADSATTSVSMNYAFASRESCGADWDVAAVLVDDTNYAYLANGKVIRVNPASGNTSITPTSQFTSINCWSSVQTIVGILNKTANPPNASGFSTHTITIAVADTGDTAVPSTFMVSMVRGGNETSGGVKTSPVNTVSPVLSVVGGAVARVGQTLSTTTGTWSNTPTSYEYTWSSSADGTSFSTISGATSSTLAITDSLRGRYIRAAVSGRNASGLGVPANTLSSTLIPLAIVLTKFSENVTTNYATAAVDTVTATNGSGTKTFTLQSSPFNAGITIDTATTNLAILKVANSVNAGTYFETITATDIYGETATTSIVVTVQKIAQSPSLTFVLSSSSGKYNDSRTVDMTPSGGSGTGLITYSIATGVSAGTATGCSLANATATNSLRSTSVGTCVIVATKAADDNYLVETSTTKTFTITAADTLTVTSDTPTALTFTGSEAVFTPGITAISGLVTGDVISGATFNYSASGGTCATGGACSIGQTGPGGGLIFITPTTVGNNTGKYFEAAPAGWSGSGTDPLAALCTNATSVAGASGTAIGTGETNTNLFAASAACGPSVTDTVTALVLNSKDDWFLPSHDELKEMYSKLHKAAGGALGGFALAADNYLSSSDNPSGVPPSGVDYALYGWFGSSNGVVGWGSTSKTSQYAYRPVRSFLVTLNPTPTIDYGPSTTKPTNAGTYVITPSALTFSSGNVNNYVAVTYRTSTLTINKAAQATLSVVPLYNVFNGNPTTATLLTTGGSDTGTVTYAYVSSGSTAGGCTLSGVDSATVTVTSAGTCRIVATKAATSNFLVAISDTGTVAFYLYVSFIPAPRPAEYPAEIVLSGATAMTNNGLAPTITFTGTDISAAPGGSFTINGSGFVGTRLVRVSGTSAAFTVLSDTSLQITMPTGLVGVSGPIYVEKAEGSRASEDWVIGVATVSI
jgi:hypothetical protein